MSSSDNQQTIELLIRLDERVKNLDAKIDEYRAEVVNDVNELDSRVKALEELKWKMTGIFITVSSIVAVIVSIITKNLTF